MADPFEVRLRFTNLLSHLSASATASIKTAHYALKHRDMDEDLHSCIIENLERNNMNNRANIMYFLEHFCDMAIKEKHIPYVDMVRRDILRIVDAVAQNGANVKVVRRVVGEMGGRAVLSEEVVKGIEESLKGKEEETGRGRLLGDEDELPDADGEQDDKDREMTVDGPADEGDRQEKRIELESQSQKVTPRTGALGGQGGKTNGLSKVDKRVIEQRIEEDRERNKRLRESVWAVTGDDAEELDKMWEESSDVGEDDYVLADEEAEERRQFARYHRPQLAD